MESSDAAPRRGRPGYDQSSMLEVIVEVFTDHGYDASSLGMIASRLGLSKSAVYHHFASKAEMLEIALERALGALERVFDEAEAEAEAGGAPAGAVGRITEIVRAAVLVACEQQPYLILLLRLHGNSEVELRALERRRALTARLRAIFERARSEGALRDDLDPGLAARFTFGLVNSLVEWYRPDGPETPEALADAVLAYVRSGLRVNEVADFR
ncbi:TetR/AcrR family transcriptional regulator [Leucobacter chromiiresistens]|uniref:DNA-binding transcriptional regulator, AcrR family n=1 Tax=Leucobacter chromiiresistens TaxID=1079994 RepID=A0A1H0Y506_9MICO|nr:TetR/AcrR family transcriptional regulator [Leucobacter chromiiresistens]SDQ10140.1 DNA-binding transcriptional regulator, AcrR family [Leucobacter chromiiresistens]